MHNIAIIILFFISFGQHMHLLAKEEMVGHRICVYSALVGINHILSGKA